ncbi:MAG: hypothetical protein IKF37_02450 [Bacilli bacterium]|nr:hypothetical protein [Bacilli bacterium]
MKKKKKGSVFGAFAIFIAFLSLGFNILLLYGIYSYSTSTPEVDPPVENKHTYTKKELGEFFKNYQTTNNLAVADSIVMWDIDKMTYRGFFKNTDKKLYYITERFTCISGNTCVTASGVQADKKYDYNAIFVVAIDFKDPYDLKFEILDYSIEESLDFVQDEIYDLE